LGRRLALAGALFRALTGGQQQGFGEDL